MRGWALEGLDGQTMGRGTKGIHGSQRSRVPAALTLAMVAMAASGPGQAAQAASSSGTRVWSPLDSIPSLSRSGAASGGASQTATPSPSPSPSGSASAAPSPSPTGTPTIQPSPLFGTTPPARKPEVVLAETPIRKWSVADARALLEVITGIAAEGLFPADYQPKALAQAIAAGPGPALDEQASRSFDWLAEDMRDGRTPHDSRVQFFAVDTDVDTNPTSALIDRAVATHDIASVIRDLAPRALDYGALRQALAALPAGASHQRDMIRINMDRWRWLPRDLGLIYLITNVPEFELRLMRGDRIVRTYRTVVGKPGRTATPQLAEQVKAVVFNPTWTVPQSIIEHEGLGEKVQNAAYAARNNYKVYHGANGQLTIVQQPGDKNSLGRMKIDMPNPHAIYLHDTPSKRLFAQPMRAYSHGCIRTERAVELGMTMAMLGADLTPEKAVELADSGKYNRVVMTKTFPVYITYFTVGRDINGQLATFKDIYDRDGAVLQSFASPRQLHTTQRTSKEEIIKLDNPL